jgi:hypothetical protein
VVLEQPGSPEDIRDSKWSNELIAVQRTANCRSSRRSVRRRRVLEDVVTAVDSAGLSALGQDGAHPGSGSRRRRCPRRRHAPHGNDTTLQCLVIAAVATRYPSRLRGTSLGFALGVGRIGAVLAPLVGGWLLDAKLGVGSNFIAFSLAAGIAAVLLFVTLVVTRRPVTSAPRQDVPADAFAH